MRYFVVSMVSVAVLFTIVVSLLLWIMARGTVSGAPGLCSTPGCAELAAAFESMLNYSVDPCEDMHAFVCSKGIPRSSGAGRSSLSLVANVIRQYELQMVKMFVEGQTTFRASSMVSDFLRACTSSSKTPPSVEPFVTFFENVFVPWPFGVPYDKEQHPLESVLTLTLNYGISTWFRAYVLMARQRAFASNSSVKPTLFIEAAASASLWLDFVRTVEAVGGRNKYHELFLARYNASLSERASVSKRLAVEKDILSTLDEARLPRASLQPVLASLAKIAAAVPNTAVRNWIGPVGNAPGGLDADKKMLVVVRDVRILRAIQRLLTAYSLHDLMRHLSWWLVQILTVIGWPQGYVVIAGSQEIVVWPPDVEGSNGTLWLSYESFCLSCKHGNKSGATASVTTAAPHMDLIRFWMRANTQFLPLSAEQIERMQLLWQWDPLDLLYYNPWYNRLRVSHAALRSPIYQPSSPELRKANFGSLGTSFFFSVLQMFAEPCIHPAGMRQQESLTEPVVVVQAVAAAVLLLLQQQQW
ncbi:phosphate-regulating neutral endopeptidase PHEX-like [Dermacentor silvarum]|uniref:phosphate-regulating neutral endopeptidase PHEX-like n=1 Tax=Dermacentor silvarum TaxID=543639 RepID=UPI0021018010|nr:phosphate-regulating neutral endopeptidase PHEX-like [Dermacentor silvarum]